MIATQSMQNKQVSAQSQNYQVQKVNCVTKPPWQLGGTVLVH